MPLVEEHLPWLITLYAKRPNMTIAVNVIAIVLLLILVILVVWILSFLMRIARFVFDSFVILLRVAIAALVVLIVCKLCGVQFANEIATICMDRLSHVSALEFLFKTALNGTTEKIVLG